MKRYVPIVIGVVALCAVLYVGDSQMKKDKEVTTDESTSTMMMSSFSGSVTRSFEGDTTLEYTFSLPESATTSVEKDGALVKVSDAGVPVAAMYFSFEGARGYSPADYITNTIVPNVKAITSNGTVTIGSYDWDVVESEWSVWHVAKSTDGKWLIVVENKKDVNQEANTIIESISTK